MDKQKKAFTLIELMVYTSLFSVVVLLGSSLVGIVFSTVRQHYKRVAIELKAAVVLDSVWRDVMAASMKISAWDCAKGVFVKECLDKRGNPVSTAVAWEACVLKNNQQGLRRSEGVYDFAAHQWKKRTESVIACPITSLQFFYQLDDDQQKVRRVRIEYTPVDQTHERSLWVKIRNRVMR